jgi:hypothetical protein
MPQQLCPDATYTPSTPGNLHKQRAQQIVRLLGELAMATSIQLDHIAFCLLFVSQ